MLSKYNELFVVWLGDGWLNLGSSAYSWIYCLTALTRMLKFAFADMVSMYSLTPVFYFVTGDKGIYRSVVLTVKQKGCMHARVLNLLSSLTTRGQSGQTGRLVRRVLHVQDKTAFEPFKFTRCSLRTKLCVYHICPSTKWSNEPEHVSTQPSWRILWEVFFLYLIYAQVDAKVTTNPSSSCCFFSFQSHLPQSKLWSSTQSLSIL